ncbi:hypothetical protein [Staphylococcus aureus]|uniref:hypothetical protein n=1 Tax=Staphylococcus aureus TaxID=1280 RepID=UPI001F5BB6BD|nr:hypothetical protein [Staphylococcus aureus]
MLQKFRIAKEKSKLKLNLLKHANSNLETRNNPERRNTIYCSFRKKCCFNTDI